MGHVSSAQSATGAMRRNIGMGGKPHTSANKYRASGTANAPTQPSRNDGNEIGASADLDSGFGPISNIHDSEPAGQTDKLPTVDSSNCESIKVRAQNYYTNKQHPILPPTKKQARTISSP